MYLKTLSLGDIHPYERNPRINDKAVEPVMKSIQKDGYRARIIVDKDGVIIAGHTRYEAMKRLGWTEAEVWIADDMTPEQIADYRIRDNLTADFAEWDFSELEAEIEEKNLDFTMAEFGVSGIDDSENTNRKLDAVATNNPTLMLPKSRIYIFAVSAFGTESEVFMQAIVSQNLADKIIQARKDNKASALFEKIKDVINES